MKLIAYLTGVLVVVGVFVGLVRADNGSYGWAAPSAKTIKKISPIYSAQHEPNFLNNLDCSLIEYRQTGDSQMRTGCFTPTAFGMLDSDSDVTIFNGTDEGLPLLPNSAHQILVPWPDALNLLALDAAVNGGSYVSMYKNPLPALKDQRNIFAQLVSKQLSEPPDLQLVDSAGKPLIINPQTMAFSDGGSWMVVESTNGHFERINLATLDVMDFAPSYGANGDPSILKSRVAISDDGKYVAIANQAASEFKVYDLSNCAASVCKSYDYQAFIKQQIAGLQSVRHVRFVNRGLISLEAVSSNPDNNGIYELAPTDSIESLIDYLGTGDSYTSGEGAFDYISGTDSPQNMCHLSANSYPLLLTRDLFSSSGGHSVACSGAVINDIAATSGSYRGQVKDVASYDQLKSSEPALLNSVMANFLPGYIAQQRFVAYYQPRIITVSIGGNDVGFGDMLENCVMPHVSIHLSDSDCYNTYEDRAELIKLIDKTSSKLSALYKQLKTESPVSKLYAVGYPSVVYDKGNCGVNAHLGKNELEFAEETIDYLNTSIKNAAAKAGVNYVDISKALAGHRLCETTGSNVAVNGLTAGKDGAVAGLKVFGKESYHPNKLGQALIEQEILKRTNNFKADNTPTSTPSNTPLLNAPKSGRQITSKIPAKTTSEVVRKSKPANVKISGLGIGLKPNSTYDIRLNGPNGQVISSVVSDGNANIDTSITLPADTSTGSNTIDVVGQDQSGDIVDVTQPIYVPVSDNDSDGDGIQDAKDSCPAAANSGQDQDNDGIDDTCDGYISSSDSNGSPPGPLPSISEGVANNLSGGGNISASLKVNPATKRTLLGVARPQAKLSVNKPASNASKTLRRSTSHDVPHAAGQIPKRIYVEGVVALWSWILLAIIYIWWATNRDKPTYQYRRLL